MAVGADGSKEEEREEGEAKESEDDEEAGDSETLDEMTLRLAMKVFTAPFISCAVSFNSLNTQLRCQM